MKPIKTFVYRDALNDDFAATKNLRAVKVSAKHPYLRKNPLWIFLAFLVYRVIVTPIAFLYCKIIFRVRIQGRRHLRGIRGGYVLYGNHTQSVYDAFSPTLLTFPRKAFILTGAQSVSIIGMKQLVQMLGAMPLPDDPHGLVHLGEAVQTRLKRGSVICIYPEAHIWPYYTGIRPFRSGSFVYPVRCGVPAVPFVVTYRERKLFKNRHPLITVKIGRPVYPDAAAPERAERQRLREECYRFMRREATGAKQPEYIRYIRDEAATPAKNTEYVS